MNALRIIKPKGPINSTVTLPFSKSIFNRVLILEALSGGRVKVGEMPDSEDAKLMKELISLSKARPNNEPICLNADNSGTVLRFLTSYLCMQEGFYLLTGSARMKERPVLPLVSALRSMGAEIAFTEKDGFPPLMIKGNPGLLKSTVDIDPSISSQFLSALLLIAPFMHDGLKINLTREPVSESYANMTIVLLKSLGVKVEQYSGMIKVFPFSFEDRTIHIERDWSAAGFWYEVAALSGNCSLVLNELSANSCQGDRVSPSLFDQLGLETSAGEGFITLKAKVTKHPQHITQSFLHYPDLAIPFICTCAGLWINLTVHGVSHLHIKESDRIFSLSEELKKIGCVIRERDDCLEINSTSLHFPSSISFDSHGDHRMAMSLAPFALMTDEVIVNDPDVVVKSYPLFWEEFSKVGFNLEYL